METTVYQLNVSIFYKFLDLLISSILNNNNYYLSLLNDQTVKYLFGGMAGKIRQQSVSSFCSDMRYQYWLIWNTYTHNVLQIMRVFRTYDLHAFSAVGNMRGIALVSLQVVISLVSQLGSVNQRRVPPSSTFFFRKIQTFPCCI